MTEEFMRDVGANDILEAAAWSLSADPGQPGTGNNNSNYQAYSGTTVQQNFSIPDERRFQFTSSLSF